MAQPTKTHPKSFEETLIAKGLVPEFVIRRAIRSFGWEKIVAETQTNNVVTFQERKLAFVKELKTMPIAVETRAANEQHYEVPTSFFQHCLGPYMKYSCCYFGYDGNRNTVPTTKDLAVAEVAMNKLYGARADLKDGLKVLDVGCGWGSFSLWAAATYPGSSFTAVSNSATQREFIEKQCEQRKIKNLKVITADINVFTVSEEEKFDRVVSIEMFEHMKNYEKLLEKIASWMKVGAKLFVHIFVHREIFYHYVVRNDGDWMAKYFFSGGTMPSDDLLAYFQKDLTLVDQWRVDGRNYGLTSECWLQNFYNNLPEIRKIMAETYGPENAETWVVRWRLFYIAVAEYFALDEGSQYFVSHYLFEKKK